MSFLPGSWRKWINRSAAGPFLNADNLNDLELKLRALDCLGAFRAVSLVDTLPGSPVDGDTYLTSATATPANKLVRRFDGAWESFTPLNGMVAFLADGSAKQFTAGAWATMSFSGAVASVFGRTGAVTAQTGDYTAAQVGALATSQKGAANGVAELDATGRVPSGQLPSYVDDVLEFANVLAFPAVGEDGKIYVSVAGNTTWRWSGSVYTEISASLTLGETPATAYRGDRGKTAYDHSQVEGNAHNMSPDDIGAWGSINLPVTTFAKTLLDDSTASEMRATIGAAKSPSTEEVSTSRTFGSITGSAVKVIAAGVEVELIGGSNGQGWDVICPLDSVDFVVPSGVTLFGYNGIYFGPTTYHPGGGRAFRIVRIDTTTWIMPNFSP